MTSLINQKKKKKRKVIEIGKKVNVKVYLLYKEDEITGPLIVSKSIIWSSVVTIKLCFKIEVT